MISILIEPQCETTLAGDFSSQFRGFFNTNSDLVVNIKEIIVCSIPTIKPPDDEKTHVFNNTIIACTPYTDFIGGVMYSVGKELNSDVQFVVDENFLVSLAFDMLTNNEVRFIGVVFSPTSELTYKIRYRLNWRTAEAFEGMESIQSGPNYEYKDHYLETGFITLQMTINKYIIAKTIEKLQDPTTLTHEYKPYGLSTTRKPIKVPPIFDVYKIQTEVFPYPEYTAVDYKYRTLIQMTVVCALILGSYIVLSPIMIFMIREKEMGLNALLKVNGTEEWILWLSWFLGSLLPGVAMYFVITILLCVKFSENHPSIIIFAQPSVIFTYLVLYCASNISFCFLFCAIYQKSSDAILHFIIISTVIATVSFQLDNLHYSILTIIICFCPVGAFIEGFRRILYYEMLGVPLTWKSLTSSELNASESSMAFVFCMLIVNVIMYLFLTFYFHMINKGKFGHGRSPLFLFQESEYSLPFYKAVKYEDSDDQDVSSKYFEPVSKFDKIILQITDLRKEVPNMFTVKTNNITILENDIFVLLGKSGYGKTTVLSMLLGLKRPTSGSIVYKQSLDVLSRLKVFTKDVGYCPQENHLLPYLDVQSHLILYSMVLVLDEPTYGMDTESKQLIWKLFSVLRKSSTIILSSKNKEDTETLGNRIAIMNQGVVVCCGTTKFLNTSFNTGYKLTVTRKKGIVSEKRNVFSVLVNTITKSIPSARVLAQSVQKFEILLPLSEATKCPSLCKILEVNKPVFNIEQINLTSSSLEEVFSKIDEPYFFSEQRQITDSIVKSRRSEKSEKIFGIRLIVLQLKVLLVKKYLFVLRNRFFFFIHVFITSLVMVFIIGESSSFVELVEPELELSLKIVYPKSYVMLLENDYSNKLYGKYNFYLNRLDANVIVSKKKDIIAALLNYGRENINTYRRDLILASDLNVKRDKKVRLLYNPWALHALPVAIDLWMNTLFEFLTHNSSMKIRTINYPIKLLTRDKTESDFDTVINYLPTLTVWYVLLGFFTVDLLYYFAISVSVERIHGFKHIQIMTGVPVLIYWLSHLIFDTLFFMVLVLSRYLLMREYDTWDFFVFGYETFVATLIMALFVVSGLLFIYVITYDVQLRSLTYIFFFILNLLAGAFAFVYYAYLNDYKYLPGHMYIVLKSVKILPVMFRVIISITPPLNFYLAMEKFIVIWTINNWFFPSPNQTKLNYLEFPSSENSHGIMLELVCFLGDILVYAVILFVIEKGYVGKLSSSIVSIIKKDAKTSRYLDNSQLDDEDDELRHVPVVVGKKNALTVQRLHKIFLGIPSIVPVKDVTFIVKTGECFAFVGPKDAGKTTIIKMLTGEIMPTRGRSWIFDISLETNRENYMRQCGYCAEDDYILEELSAKESLNLIAALRGISDEERNDVVYDWIYNLGLDSVQDHKSGTYNRGSKKKLGTAMAMIGDPIVVFLDEPTAGVDASSKRKLYEAIELSKYRGQATLVTFTSLQECELVCDHLSILMHGSMKFIGPVDVFKRKYAEGYFVIIKIKIRKSTSETLKIINYIKNEISQNLHNRKGTWLLKSEEESELHYKVKYSSLMNSQIFEIMEELRKKIKSISRYLINEIPLDYDNIFLE